MNTNPFRALFLSAKASASAVRHRVQQLSIRLRMENGDEAPLRAAQQAIEDPCARLAAEPFWFWGQDGPDDPTLSADGRNEASDELRFGVTAREVIAHDQAIHALLDADTAERLSDRERRARWERMVGAWKPLLSGGVIDRWLRARAVELDDPRLTAAEVERIRGTMVGALASPMVTLAEDDIEAGNAPAVSSWCSLVSDLRGSDAPERAISVLRPLITRTEALVETAFRNTMASLAGEPNQPAKVRIANSMASLGILRTTVDVARAVPDFGTTGSTHARDSLASALRSVSVATFNELDDALTASSLLEEAIREASSQSLKEQLAADHATMSAMVTSVREHDRLVAAIRFFIRAGQLEEARGLLRQAASNARIKSQLDDIERLGRELQHEGARQTVVSENARKSSSLRDKIIGWGVIALVIFGAQRCFASSSSNSGTVGANPTTVNRAATSSASTSSNSAGSGSVRVSSSTKARADALNAQIDEARTRAERLGRELETLTSEIDTLRRSMETTKAIYGNSGAPSYVVDQYERDRARFNGLVDQHTTLLSRYRQVVAEVNQKVDEHNTLLRSGS